MFNFLFSCKICLLEILLITTYSLALLFEMLYMSAVSNSHKLQKLTAAATIIFTWIIDDPKLMPVIYGLLKSSREAILSLN